ncbi:hypothetical protein MANES_10G090900v8 [Manihot esculenta]|uniref:Uncharacterized protein n=2 Tax=Manihot esculenta TaxID=3983 RepID=A0ACB7H0Q2_MANES|nr:hypothetical protein MANES_10G090900v8 [Manihot esculenta]KAG8645767.1 hypothetical protein MANES_10G090900v8 [Manihot esculenta]
MEVRPLGNTRLKVSSVGFGASPLGRVFGPVSEEEAIASVSEAFRRGINFFDTSPYYGGTLSEKMLGKGLKALGVPRNEYVVSTKCGRYKEGFDFSAQRVTRSIDESLERLQLEYVDILQCHDIEFGSLDQIVKETIPALQKLKEAGKIRFIGITGLPLGIFTYVLDRVPPGTVDVILSYCHYSINDSTLVDLLPYLKSKGVGIISASPLAMGLLTEDGPPEWHPASPELKVHLIPLQCSMMFSFHVIFLIIVLLMSKDILPAKILVCWHYRNKSSVLCLWNMNIIGMYLCILALLLCGFNCSFLYTLMYSHSYLS